MPLRRRAGRLILVDHMPSAGRNPATETVTLQDNGGPIPGELMGKWKTGWGGQLLSPG